ncbi:MAG TPA: hypothetical protein V6D50_04680 [Chroococcales cyanobacterium]
MDAPYPIIGRVGCAASPSNVIVWLTPFFKGNAIASYRATREKS